MQKMSSNNAITSGSFSAKPTMPLIKKKPAAKRTISDPSSVLPKGESYPIPSFFEYRIKPLEFDFV